MNIKKLYVDLRDKFGNIYDENEYLKTELPPATHDCWELLKPASVPKLIEYEELFKYPAWEPIAKISSANPVKTAWFPTAIELNPWKYITNYTFPWESILQYCNLHILP